MHYYQFNIADYQSHAKHLTPIEDICYRRLLDWQYLHEKAIPTDLKSVCRLLMLRDYQDDVEQVINEFFVLTEEGWVNQRAFEEIQEFHFHEENNQAREDNEKDRKKRHREERRRLFSDLRDAGVIPPWNILIGPLRELHKLHCDKKSIKTNDCDTQTSNESTCDAPVTHQERLCDEPGTAITINHKPITINQEPLTIHTPNTVPNYNQEKPTPSPAALVCLELRKFGFGEVNQAHPLLLELLKAGATTEEFIFAATEAKKRNKDFKYLLGIVKGQRKEAMDASKQILHGEIKNKPPPRAPSKQEMASIAARSFFKNTREDKHEREVTGTAEFIEPEPPI